MGQGSGDRKEATLRLDARPPRLDIEWADV
jgi:hypothetical protein